MLAFELGVLASIGKPIAGGHVGLICSYDAYNAETENKLRAWSQAEALSIDCESAPTFVAASHKTESGLGHRLLMETL